MAKLNNSNTESKMIRNFSIEFKKKIIEQLDSKLTTIAEIVRNYNVSSASVCKWRQKYSHHYNKPTTVVVQMESEALKNDALNKRNAELERIIGQKQLKIDFLEKLIEIASEELKIDLKKNFDTAHSITSSNITKS